jgi:hypothetical protein
VADLAQMTSEKILERPARVVRADGNPHREAV